MKDEDKQQLTSLVHTMGDHRHLRRGSATGQRQSDSHERSKLHGPVGLSRDPDRRVGGLAISAPKELPVKIYFYPCPVNGFLRTKKDHRRVSGDDEGDVPGSDTSGVRQPADRAFAGAQKAMQLCELNVVDGALQSQAAWEQGQGRRLADRCGVP